jgi:hypothetical protein
VSSGQTGSGITLNSGDLLNVRDSQRRHCDQRRDDDGLSAGIVAAGLTLSVINGARLSQP